MDVLFRRTDLARALGVTDARVGQLVRGIEPSAVTPRGVKLYDLATLDLLRERRRRWERSKAEALEAVQ